jgi:hypothetical protein
MFFEFYEQSGNVSSMLNNRTFVDRLSNAPRLVFAAKLTPVLPP